MAKGIIYCMTTIVPGLIKIGKAGSDNFEQRMYNLEHNGYSNVVGLKKHFAIEVEDYDEKENLIDDIFSKSKVGNTELFALDINLVVQLLSSLDGKQIYPQDKPKEVVFDEATDNKDISCIPDGDYFFNYKPRNSKEKKYKAKLHKEGTVLILCKDSEVNPDKNGITVSGWKKVRDSADIIDGIVVNDIKCDSLSMAGTLVKGSQSNGWTDWKNKNKEPVDIYRKHLKDD